MGKWILKALMILLAMTTLEVFLNIYCNNSTTNDNSWIDTWKKQEFAGFCTKSSTTLIYKWFFTEHEMRFNNLRNFSVKKKKKRLGGIYTSKQMTQWLNQTGTYMSWNLSFVMSLNLVSYSKRKQIKINNPQYRILNISHTVIFAFL